MPSDFNFRNLTSDVRTHMLAEVDFDLSSGVLYPSDRFNDTGKAQYPTLIRSAVSSHDEAWLANSLQGMFNEQEFKAGKWKKVRWDAHILFAQSEFNRFYIRGICCFALANPTHGVRVYRARASENPRPESEAKIGRMMAPAVVLADLRSRIGTDVEFGMPEVFSGLSLELVPNANSV